MGARADQFPSKKVRAKATISPPNYLTMRVVDLRKKDEKKEVAPPAIEPAPLVIPQKPELTTPDVFTTSGVPEPTKSSPQFEWEAPSFYYNPRKKYLFLIVIALLAGAGAMFFYRLDTLTAIFLVLSSVVIMLYTNKKPILIKVTVSRAGVTIDDRTYYYKELKSFWLDYDPQGFKELSLESKKWYIPYIKISIEDQNPVELRSLMINFISEKEHEKSLTDLITRKIGL